MTTKGEAAMNANGKCEVVRQFAWRGLVFAALLAMVLFGAGVTRAQSSATAVPASAAEPTAVAAPLSAPSVAKPPSNAPHEGIKVHGHWTIEVKNPDGSLVKHVEFENSLQQPLGSEILAGLLSGQLTAGPMGIGLAGPQFCASNCVGTGASNEGVIISASGEYGYSSFSAAGCSGVPEGCFPTLSVTLPTAGTLQLSGSATVPASGTITEVWTFLAYCATVPANYISVFALPASSSAVSPSQCPTIAGSTIGNVLFSSTAAPNDAFTDQPLLTPPATPSQVPVSAQQTVYVTVQISFH